MFFDGHLLTAQGWVHGKWALTPVISPVDTIPSGAQYLSGWATPGLVDAHCHIGVGHGASVLAHDEQREQLVTALKLGVSLLRDCGSPAGTSWVRSDASLPILLRCGRHIARPKRYIRGLAREVDNVNDLPSVAVEELVRGDGWVKLVGDWIDRSAGSDADLMPLWPPSVLAEAVAAVHERGGRVAVHAFSHRVIDDLIEAGVDNIEHASGMDHDQIAEARARGVAVSVTMLQRELFAEFAQQARDKYPKYAATMLGLFEKRYDQARLLFESGITVLPASDTGGYQEVGSIFQELQAWSDLGVAPFEILNRATVEARRYLNVNAGFVGGNADLMIFSQRPDECAETMFKPQYVCRRGVVVASAGENLGNRGDQNHRR